MGGAMTDGGFRLLGPDDDALKALRSDEASLLEKLALLRGEIARWTGEGDRSTWESPADTLRRQKDVSTRYATGIPTVDHLTKGGLPRGRIAVMVGRPGAGKTGLALQIAASVAQRHPEVAVGLYLADEGLEAGVIRMAQHLGFDREHLESADPDVIRAASEQLDGYRGRIYCMDPDAEDASLEAFLDGMATRADGRPQLWVIDSAQVIRLAAASAKKLDRRLAVDSVCRMVKAAARRRGAVALLLSQSNRGSYRAKREDDQADPLSSGAETAQLEHMADLFLFLSPDGDDRVKVQVPKNRIGRGPRLEPFYMALNRERATYTELDAGALAASAEADEQVARDRLVRGWCESVEKVLRKNPEGLSGTHIKEMAGLSGSKFAAARDALVATGKVFSEVREGRGGGVVWKLGRRSTEGRKEGE